MCVALEPSAVEVWVDPAARGDGTGTAVCPLSTITAALRAIDGRGGAVIHAAPGTYDAGSGEVFPLQLRAGQTLVGAGIEQTILRGRGTLFGPLPGDAGSGSLDVALELGDRASSTAVSDLTIESPDDDAVGVGVVCGRGRADDAPGGEPDTTLTRVRVRGFGTGILVTSGVDATRGGCALRVVRGELASNTRGIHAARSGRAEGVQTVELTDGTELRFQRAEGRGRGVVAGPGTRRVTVEDTTFVSGDGGLSVAAEPRDALELVVRRSVFQRLDVVGLEVVAPASVELDRSTFEYVQSPSFDDAGPARALAVTSTRGGALRLVVRNSVFFASDLAIELAVDALDGIDLGTPEAPGHNSMRCSSAPRASGRALPDVRLELAAPGGVLAIAGNTWDHTPPTEGSDNGADLSVTRARPGRVDASGAEATTTPACPADRTP